MNPNEKSNPDAFKRLILSKHPDGIASDGRRYAEIDARELTQKIVDKFPDAVTNSGIPYKSFLGQEKQKLQSFLQKAGNVVKTIQQPFVSIAAAPVQALAKAIGQPDPYANKALAGVEVSPIDKPLRKLGEVGVIASYAIPYGRFAKLGTLGKIGTGATSGYGIDVASSLAGGKTGKEALKPGLGTTLGTAIPLASPITRTLARGTGETLGVTTGTGYGVIKEAYNASLAGGDKLKSFTDSLRGRISPDSIVQEARDSLGTIVAERRNNYQRQLTQIAKDTTQLNIAPIINTLKEQLGKFRIGVTEEGLDFSRSAIRFDKVAQSDVQTIYSEMRTFGTQAGDRTAIGVDSLKQALGDLYSPSSNVRALVTSVKKSTRDVLSNIKGYDQLAKNYGDLTDTINEIQRGLSLGDKAAVDTAYKKLTSSLRLNNEQRREMIQELDIASGGALSSKIAGEQMGQILPRGIMRPLGGIGALGALGSGVGILPLLKFAAIASPRAVGELLRVLGIGVAKSQRLFDAIGGTPAIQTAIAPTVQSLNTSPVQ